MLLSIYLPVPSLGAETFSVLKEDGSVGLVNTNKHSQGRNTPRVSLARCICSASPFLPSQVSPPPSGSVTPPPTKCSNTQARQNPRESPSSNLLTSQIREWGVQASEVNFPTCIPPDGQNWCRTQAL